MFWHLTVTAGDGRPLGTRYEVVARIAAAWPQVRWVEGPSPFDQLGTVPNHPFLQLPWTEQQRAAFSQPELTGTYEEDDVTIQVSGFTSFPLASFVVQVHGDGNPMPALRKLCRPSGWAVNDPAGQPFDLDAEWAAYRQREEARKNVVFGPPERVRIPHDDGRFEHVGRYRGDHQFMAFVTGAFPADWWSGNREPEYLRTRWAEHKRWYAVLHRFNPPGDHLGTDAWSSGTTAEGEEAACKRAWRKLGEMLASLGRRHAADIEVKPFRVEQEGYLFGLVYEWQSYDDPGNPGAGYECVMLWPNDIMFHPPWDSGEYST